MEFAQVTLNLGALSTFSLLGYGHLRNPIERYINILNRSVMSHPNGSGGAIGRSEVRPAVQFGEDFVVTTNGIEEIGLYIGAIHGIPISIITQSVIHSIDPILSILHIEE